MEEVVVLRTHCMNECAHNVRPLMKDGEVGNGLKDGDENHQELMGLRATISQRKQRTQKLVMNLA